MTPMDSSVEHILEGGNVGEGVVRVGSTVRKRAGDATAATEALLDHFADVGFAGAPRSLGRDEQGRQVLEYIPGQMANTLPLLTAGELGRLGDLIREMHDAAESFRPPPSPRWWVVIAPDREDLICHHDLAPWNLVRDGDRWVFIDWDGAGPGSRLWDLAYAANSFVPFAEGGDPVLDGSRLRALADGYGLDEQQRRAFPALIAAHTRGMFDLLRTSSLTGEQPWARLYAEGHGRYWGAAADYIEAHLGWWTAVLLE
jgi:Ser/Thr protein kinase RdoA (MazF antagonist)